MRPATLLRSNLLGWGLILLGLSVLDAWSRWSVVGAGLAIFAWREVADWQAGRRRAQHARKVRMADIRTMQERMPLRRLEREEDFYLTPGGGVNWAKRARIHRATELVTSCGGPARRLLDVGCGDGLLTKRIATQGDLVVGMDISGNLVRYMLEWVDQPHVVGLEGDAEAMPFAAGSFDRVVMTETLEHLIEPQHALGEITRLLRSPGFLIVTVPNRNRLTVNPISLIAALWGSLARRRYRHRNEAIFHAQARMFFIHNAFRSRDLKLMAAEAGLKVISSGSFHLSLLDPLRRRFPTIVRGLEGAILSLPLLRHFGRYSYAVMKR